MDGRLPATFASIGGTRALARRRRSIDRGCHGWLVRHLVYSLYIGHGSFDDLENCQHLAMIACRYDNV